MQDKESMPKDVLPENFDTLEELSDFWDTHSSADYEEVMEPVEVEIDLSSSKVYCPVSKDLLRQLRKQARRQGVSTETLVNLWLQERLLRIGIRCFGSEDYRTVCVWAASNMRMPPRSNWRIRPLSGSTPMQLPVNRLPL